MTGLLHYRDPDPGMDNVLGASAIIDLRLDVVGIPSFLLEYGFGLPVQPILDLVVITELGVVLALSVR